MNRRAGSLAFAALLAAGAPALARQTPPAPGPIASAAPAAAVTSPPALDADEIFDRARARVAARVLPPFIAYTDQAAFERHGKTQAQHDRIVIRTADGKANIVSLPDSPADRVDTRPRVGKPIVNPATTFGLVKREPGETASAYESASTPIPAPQDAGPPVIGRVASRPRDYDPTLVGITTVDGAAVYHLKLVPRFDPEHHPIRDLYVDAQTFDPRRIAIEVWAQAGPVHSRPTVTVDYADVGGTWLIAHAAMDFVLRFAFLNYGGSAEYRTSDISFPAAEPDWMFDPKLLAEHVRAASPAPATAASHR